MIILALGVVFYAELPLGTASLFGEDEGCELMKAVMCNKGFTLYTDIWNDQPPVFTLLLCQAFKAFGTSLIVGRLVAAFFGMLMIGTFFWLIEQRLGTWKAILATFFLIAAPDVALLSASVMLEVPAFATALLAACLLFQWAKKDRVWWLLVSGIVMGIALQIKLTAVLIVPAMLVEIVIACKAHAGKRWWKTAISSAIKWGSVAMTTVLIIIAIWAKGSILSSWKSHFAEQSLPGLTSARDFPFQFEFIENHIECVLAAIAGVVLVICRRIWRETAFPIIFLATVSCIHAFHRPWWSYYYLHFAIPLAWLSAFAVTEAIALTGRLLATSHYRLALKKTWQGILLCSLVSFVLVRSEKRFESNIKALRSRTPVATNVLVNKMREYANQTRWVYADQDIYAFHACLSTPPELTVVVFKRFWSGQITTANLVATCRHYGTEQLVLNPAHITTEWNDFLVDYDAVYRDTNTILYVAKRITKQPNP
ncbi:MAG: glycosyltransferase family 39 protein [Verrucomicrobiota bacterium]